MLSCCQLSELAKDQANVSKCSIQRQQQRHSDEVNAAATKKKSNTEEERMALEMAVKLGKRDRKKRARQQTRKHEIARPPA